MTMLELNEAQSRSVLIDPGLTGNVIAVVEDKRTCRNPREGEEQVAGMFSADDLKRLRFLREHGKLTQGTARIAPGV